MWNQLQNQLLKNHISVAKWLQRQGQPHTSVAVSLRAVALLVSWRQKLETVNMDEEDTVVEVIKALSAASGHSTSQSTDYGGLKTVFISFSMQVVQAVCENWSVKVRGSQVSDSYNFP